MPVILRAIDEKKQPSTQITMNKKKTYFYFVDINNKKSALLLKVGLFLVPPGTCKHELLVCFRFQIL